MKRVLAWIASRTVSPDAEVHRMQRDSRPQHVARVGRAERRYWGGTPVRTPAMAPSRGRTRTR